MIYLFAPNVKLAEQAARELGVRAEECTLLNQDASELRGHVEQRSGCLYVWVNCPRVKRSWGAMKDSMVARELLHGLQIPLMEYTLQ